MRRAVVRNRLKAYLSQRKRCFYCGLPMWLAQKDKARFATRHRLSPEAAAELQCTAEHMGARRDNGTHDPWNIVAACLHCNRARHAVADPKDPLAYGQQIHTAMLDGAWHSDEVRNAFKTAVSGDA